MPPSRRNFLRLLALVSAGFTKAIGATRVNSSGLAPDTPEKGAPDPHVSVVSHDETQTNARGSAGGYIRPGTIEVIHKSFELVVVGGGLSGTCAAISAARNGVKVALIHERSTLGGNSSSEVRLYPEDTCRYVTWCRETGILDEIYTEERARNWEPFIEGIMNSQWDLTLYEWAKRESNLTLFLNTTMREVEMADEFHILAIHAAQLGTEKEFIIRAPLFVDASGDGVLIYRSGARFRKGKEARSEYGEPTAPEKTSDEGMGNTLYFRARDTGSPVPFTRPEWATTFPTEEGLTPPFSRNHENPSCGYWWIEVASPMDWIHDNEEIRDELLRQVMGVWDHIKNRCADRKVRLRAQNYALEFVGFWPYKRESRRMLGDYVLREQDIRNPSPRPDDIGFGSWGIDIHTPGGVLKLDALPGAPMMSPSNFEEWGAIPYGIPLRSCYSQNVVNLMAAGRPISASYVAFSSSRVLATGAVTGQGVGAAAALCKKYQCLPREVAANHANELQQLLVRQDCFIPGVRNTDPKDIARLAHVSASSTYRLHFPESQQFYAAQLPLAQIFPVSSGTLENVDLLLKSKSHTTIEVQLGLRKAAHAWDFRSDGDIATVTAKIAPGYEGYVPFAFNVKTDPASFYYVHMDANPDISWALWSDPEGAPSLVPVGVTPAERPGVKRWKCIAGSKAFTMRVTPSQHPYAAENVNRGMNRPDQWTNVWISDPELQLPAWVELKLPENIDFNVIQITFDTNINVRVTRPLFRFPECIKDYEIAVYESGAWNVVGSGKDNYHRRVVHTFPNVRTDRIRIRALETNGTKSARIYEVRIYNEQRTAPA